MSKSRKTKVRRSRRDNRKIPKLNKQQIDQLDNNASSVEFSEMESHHSDDDENNVENTLNALDNNNEMLNDTNHTNNYDDNTNVVCINNDTNNMNNDMDEQKHYLNGLETLIQMGFDQNMATEAMKQCNNDIVLALLLLIDAYTTNLNQNEYKHQEKDICESGIENCLYLKTLYELNMQYINNKDSNIDIVKVLNKFHHLLFNHNGDNEYEYIYNRFGGDCTAETCDIIQKHFRDRGKDDKNTIDSAKYDNKSYHLKEIFEQIHCHYRHQYDIGSRLHRKEQSLIEYDTKDDDEKRNRSKSKAPLMRLTNILRNKRMKHRQIDNRETPQKESKVWVPRC